MDRGAWQAIVHGFTKHWTRLSTHTCISLDTTGKARSMEHNLGTAGIRATRTFGFWISWDLLVHVVAPALPEGL